MQSYALAWSFVVLSGPGAVSPYSKPEYRIQRNVAVARLMSTCARNDYRRIHTL